MIEGKYPSRCKKDVGKLKRVWVAVDVIGCLKNTKQTEPTSILLKSNESQDTWI